MDNYTLIPNKIIDDENVDAHAKLAWITLKYFCYGKKETCFPGMQKLAKKMNCSERQVRGALKQLQENGYIEVKRRGLGLTNLYTIPDVLKT